MTLLSALRAALGAALGASCGPLPPHRPVTEADTLRREVAALQRACESHRVERQRLEAANAGLREVCDGLEAAVDTLTAERDPALAVIRRAVAGEVLP